MTRVQGKNAEWDDARTLASRCLPPLGQINCSIVEGIGHALVHDFASLSDVPPAHTAMMDGYAVCGPAPWPIVGQVHAGQNSAIIETGQALRVSTGAHIPSNTLRVIPQESAVVEDGIVTGFVADGNVRKSHIRLPGDEAKKGNIIARAGTLITPVVAGLLSTIGHDVVDVYDQPTIDVIVTGDELIRSGAARPGAIRDSLSMQIPSWITWANARVGSVHVIHDSQRALEKQISASRANIIIVTGGSAHGARDYARPVLAELEAELIVDQIKVKPGHPTILAGLPTHQIVANLPGNPLAACVAFMTVVDPLIYALTGRKPRVLNSAPLATPTTSDRTRVIPVTLGNGVATPTEFGGSAMLRGLAQADSFAVVEPGIDIVTCRLLPVPWILP
ncbi:MAG: hypothetical protein F2839_06135 [Actinobacteria bacterium]|uniref:Unannotated protein n=1 Tax=freshwater metagenome TaxID=449393 RepID=A0A6J5ZUL2_9ZZZZ|nr:hypothetical protein [Actinomycetota bacterium]